MLAALILIRFVSGFDLDGSNSQPAHKGAFKVSNLPLGTSSVHLVALADTQTPSSRCLNASSNTTLKGAVVGWSEPLSVGWYALRAHPSGIFASSSVYLHDGYELIGNVSHPGISRTFAVTGRQALQVRVARHYSSHFVKFLFFDDAQSVVVPGSLDPISGIATTTTPAWKTPAGWYSGCEITAGPERSESCTPALSAMVAVSLDGGTTFSSPLPFTFGWVKPLKVAFIYNDRVDRFGWSYAANRGRLLEQSKYGFLIDATTYLEDMVEGQFALRQQNKGSTIATNTSVPPVFNDGTRNAYYPVLSLLKRLCDDDYDLVFTFSFGYMSQTIDVSSGYRPCQETRSGEPDSTHFVHVSGYQTNDLTSTMFGKIYQMRYLSGLVAGDALAAPLLSPYSTRRGNKCVGYIAAYPIPEVQRGINAFTLGCRERYPDCVVKVLWTGTWGEGQIEAAAAEFLSEVGECDVLAQHSDSTVPQYVFKQRGGVGIGYNSDMRQLVGESVLTSAMFNWAPVCDLFIQQQLRGEWQPNFQAWPGVAEGAVELVTSFSPKVSPTTEQYVNQRLQELRGAKGDDAFHHIFCGPLTKRWAYEYVDTARAQGPRAVGCGFQPVWRRLEKPTQLNLKHYVDKDGFPLPPNRTVPLDTDCLWGRNFPGEALLGNAFPAHPFDEDNVYNDFLVEGVELFEPGTFEYGIIHSNSSHQCIGTAVGDRFFERLDPTKRKPKEVRIGVLLPSFGTNATGHETFEWSPLVGVYQALREINNKSDGVADELLPATTIRFAYADSKCDSMSGLVGALHLVQDSFNKAGVSAIIGPGCSGAAVPAAQVAQIAQIPIISPSATSTSLSNRDRFRYFLRTIPSNGFSSIALADVLKNLWAYSVVALIHSSDEYSADLASSFTTAASANGITIVTTVRFASNAAEFQAQLSALERSTALVDVLFCQPHEAGGFLRHAYEYGLRDRLWVGSDALFIEELWTADPLLRSNSSLRELVLRGSFALATNGQPVERPAYQSYLSRRRQLPSRISGEGACDLELDDDNGYLWSRDHDEDPSTPLACIQRNLLQDGPFDSFAYDAVYSLARALHQLIEVEQLTEVVGSQLLDSLIEGERFEGATGTVTFKSPPSDSGYTGAGDRTTGVLYTLVNYQDHLRGLVPLGSWTPCRVEGCGWSERWKPIAGTNARYSTIDNSLPKQKGSCSYGERLNDKGLCTCDVGFVFDAAHKWRCVPCPVHTSGPGGEFDCEVCESGRYLEPNTVASTLNCKPCLEGAECPWNTTLETLHIQPGFWRLSTLSSTLYKCDPDLESARIACIGWQGAESNITCVAGHTGPLCKVCIEDHHYLERNVCTRCPDVGLSLGAVISFFVSLVAFVVGIYCFKRQSPSKARKLRRLVIRSMHTTRGYMNEVGLVAKIKITVVFSQVIAKLNSAYDIGLPNLWFKYTKFFRLAGELDMASWMVPSDCIFTDPETKLLFRSLIPLMIAVALPVIGALIGLRSFSRYRTMGKEATGTDAREFSPLGLLLAGQQQAATRSQAMVNGAIVRLPLTLVITFAFAPAVSSEIFSTWHCESFNLQDGKQLSFLAGDLSMSCDDSSEYLRLKAVAWVLIAIWPIGMVVLYSALLLLCRTRIRDGDFDSPLIRATEFLHRDYQKKYFWWEVPSLIQRTVLTGWLLMLEGHVGMFRILFALLIATAYLTALLVVRPHKRKLDHALAAGCQILFILIFFGGHMVKLYEDINLEYNGGVALASRIIGIGSTEEVTVVMITATFGMLGLVAFTVSYESYTHFAEQHLQRQWSVCTLDPPHVNWTRDGIYACCLCYYQMEASSDARYMHDMLRKMMRAPVFSDSAARSDWRHMIEEGVRNSDTLMLLMTKSVLSRPCCLLALHEAVRKGIPVLVVHLASSMITIEEARDFVTNLEREMSTINPEGFALLRQHVGQRFEELKRALTTVLDANDRTCPITFAANAGDNAMVATMRSAVNQMAALTSRQVTWASGRAKASRQNSRILTKKNSVRQQVVCGVRRFSASLSFKSLLSAPGVVNHGSSIFIACSRNDATSHARVLRSELQVKLGQACSIGGDIEADKWIEGSQLVVVLLTKSLLSNPIALSEVWRALDYGVPLATVAIAGGGYDNAEAARVFSNLSASLEGGEKGAADKFQQLLPQGITIAQVGERLYANLTAIEALSWFPPASSSHLSEVAEKIVAIMHQNRPKNLERSRTWKQLEV